MLLKLHLVGDFADGRQDFNELVGNTPRSSGPGISACGVVSVEEETSPSATREHARRQEDEREERTGERFAARGHGVGRGIAKDEVARCHSQPTRLRANSTRN